MGDRVVRPWSGCGQRAPHGWNWRLLVPAPPHVSAAAVGTAAARFGAPVQLRMPAAQRVARLLHIGPYADEGPSLAALYAFVAEHGLAPAGPHTEIYLTDPGSTPVGELRTILQVPVCPAGRCRSGRSPAWPG